eukprot:229673_1
MTHYKQGQQLFSPPALESCDNQWQRWKPWEEEILLKYMTSHPNTYTHQAVTDRIMVELKHGRTAVAINTHFNTLKRSKPSNKHKIIVENDDDSDDEPIISVTTPSKIEVIGPFAEDCVDLSNKKQTMQQVQETLQKLRRFFEKEENEYETHNINKLLYRLTTERWDGGHVRLENIIGCKWEYFTSKLIEMQNKHGCIDRNKEKQIMNTLKNTNTILQHTVDTVNTSVDKLRRSKWLGQEKKFEHITGYGVQYFERISNALQMLRSNSMISLNANKNVINTTNNRSKSSNPIQTRNVKQLVHTERMNKSGGTTADASTSEKTMKSGTTRKVCGEQKIKKFECWACGKRFTLNQNLKVHIRVHTGERPYKCKYCAKRFKDSRAQINHHLTHTGEKPHECKVCHKRFGQGSSYNRHLRSPTHKQKLKESIECMEEKSKIKTEDVCEDISLDTNPYLNEDDDSIQIKQTNKTNKSKTKRSREPKLTSWEKMLKERAECSKQRCK